MENLIAGFALLFAFDNQYRVPVILLTVFRASNVEGDSKEVSRCLHYDPVLEKPSFKQQGVLRKYCANIKGGKGVMSLAHF